MQWLARGFIINVRAGDQRFQNVRQHLRVGTRCQRTLLRATKPCSGNHLHGACDLARIDHATNAAPNVENVGYNQLRAMSGEPSRVSAMQRALGVGQRSLLTARRSLLTATLLLLPADPARMLPCTP